MSLKHENKFEFVRIFTALRILNIFTNLELLRCKKQIQTNIAITELRQTNPGYCRSHSACGEQQVFGIKRLRRKLGDDSLAETDTHYQSTIFLLTFWPLKPTDAFR